MTTATNLDPWQSLILDEESESTSAIAQTQGDDEPSRENMLMALHIEYTTLDDETLARVMRAARSAMKRTSTGTHEREFSPIARKPFSLLR